MSELELQISVDENNPTPPYEQIRSQIAQAIVVGALGADERLAPVRQLAGDLGVAPGTVARAYRELETSGYVVTKRGGGTRVSTSAPRSAIPIADDPLAPQGHPQTQRIAAYGIALQGDEVLLVRSSNQSKLAGTWFLPGGGIDWGEAPEEAVVREFEEETGLEVSLGDLLDVSSAINVFTDETLHTVRIIYQVNVVSGDLRVEADGTTDAVEWMPLDRVGELRLAEFVVRVIGKLHASQL